MTATLYGRCSNCGKMTEYVVVERVSEDGESFTKLECEHCENENK